MPYYLECKYSSYKEINHKSNNMLFFFQSSLCGGKGWDYFLPIMTTGIEFLLLMDSICCV